MHSSPSLALKELRQQVVACRRCPRLVDYTSGIAREKVSRFRDWSYWGKPVPGFGDPKAELLIIGLAPAAHGANRTGRMFTGDSSGDWLVRALYETHFANQPKSVNADDGLKLNSVYLAAVIRCAPPSNKPLASEISNCSEYLEKELSLLHDVKVVLALGRIAFDRCLNLVLSRGDVRPEFRHGAFYKLRSIKPVLVASYHPSRQNTQTGKLTWSAWIDVFSKIRRIIDNPKEQESFVTEV